MDRSWAPIVKQVQLKNISSETMSRRSISSSPRSRAHKFDENEHRERQTLVRTFSSHRVTRQIGSMSRVSPLLNECAKWKTTTTTTRDRRRASFLFSGKKSRLFLSRDFDRQGEGERDRPMIFVSCRENVRLILSKCHGEEEDLLRSLRPTDDRMHWFACCADRMSALMGYVCVRSAASRSC